MAASPAPPRRTQPLALRETLRPGAANHLGQRAGVPRAARVAPSLLKGIPALRTLVPSALPRADATRTPSPACRVKLLCRRRRAHTLREADAPTSRPADGTSRARTRSPREAGLMNRDGRRVRAHAAARLGDAPRTSRARLRAEVLLERSIPR